MIEIQCPRCLQYWYSELHVQGRRARFCPGCADRASRGRGPTGGRVQLGAFAVVAAVLLIIDGLWITFTALWPETVGMYMVLYGGILLLPCALWMSTVMRRTSLGAEFDWSIHKWPVMIGLIGLACVLAFFSIPHTH